MTTVKNVHDYPRTWSRLVNTETGRTLCLGPGEQGETELPEDFHDQYLEVVGAAKPKGDKNKDAEVDNTEDKDDLEIENEQVAPADGADIPADIFDPSEAPGATNDSGQTPEDQKE